VRRGKTAGIKPRGEGAKRQTNRWLWRGTRHEKRAAQRREDAWELRMDARLHAKTGQEIQNLLESGSSGKGEMTVEVEV